YAAHTNLDAAWEGVSYEIAHTLKLFNLRVLVPNPKVPDKGLGVVGDIAPVPKMEFLRKVKEAFGVKALRFSAQSPQLVIRKVAVCGGAGASFIRQALSAGADAYVTGDVKYHDFTTYGLDLLIADMGHYESELCAQRIFSRIIREAFPDLVVYFAEAERNPIQII
ncbi:MAG: Nif3-like dinuclear metal center hexameric protein, partial [Muribaculaceae bacterium]|nr:Nif3-like dinuclear metal center hexameric protein [Muribaculaceae bacterium]